MVAGLKLSLLWPKAIGKRMAMEIVIVTIVSLKTLWSSLKAGGEQMWMCPTCHDPYTEDKVWQGMTGYVIPDPTSDQLELAIRMRQIWVKNHY